MATFQNWVRRFRPRTEKTSVASEVTEKHSPETRLIPDVVLPRIPRTTGPKYSYLFGWPNRADAQQIASAFNSAVKSGIASLGLGNDATFTLCHTEGYPANPWIHVWMDAGKDDTNAHNALRRALARLGCESPQVTDPVNLNAASIDQVWPALGAKGTVVILDNTFVYLCGTNPSARLPRASTEVEGPNSSPDRDQLCAHGEGGYLLDGIQFEPGEFKRFTRSDLFRESIVELTDLGDQYVKHQADGLVLYILFDERLAEVIVNGKYETDFLGISSGKPEWTLNHLGYGLVRHEDAHDKLWSYWTGPSRKPVVVVSREYSGELLEVHYWPGPLMD